MSQPPLDGAPATAPLDGATAAAPLDGATASLDGTPAAAFDALAAAWRQRKSVRAFRPEPLPRAALVRMFEAAQRAPSWCNVQPWRVAVTEPPHTAALTEALLAAARSQLPQAEVPFPLDYPPPYKEHRVACGKALYQAMGVARDDKQGRYDAWLRNYALFDAPHVAIVSCDRRLGPYAYVDVGVWLGYVLSAAAVLGIDTCPMASVAAYPATLRQHLPIAETDAILFGIALGHADERAPANACRTTREPAAANVAFVSGPSA
ncbi:MAG TPA: nitroreductase [Kofleriaceae bacterium]|nr:nitroreductase [Kofleriaceae bacterium]